MSELYNLSEYVTPASLDIFPVVNVVKVVPVWVSRLRVAQDVVRGVSTTLTGKYELQICQLPGGYGRMARAPIVSDDTGADPIGKVPLPVLVRSLTLIPSPATNSLEPSPLNLEQTNNLAPDAWVAGTVSSIPRLTRADTELKASIRTISLSMRA